MRVILRFVARLLGATLLTTVVLISLTATAAAARTHAVLVSDQGAPSSRLQPAVVAPTTPWTVVVWLAAGLVIVAAAGVTLTVVGRLRTARVGRSGTSR